MKPVQQNLTSAANSFQRTSQEVLEKMRNYGVPRRQEVVNLSTMYVDTRKVYCLSLCVLAVGKGRLTYKSTMLDRRLETRGGRGGGAVDG